MAVRLCCYALLPRAPSPWLVLPVELLHGVSFATSWGAGIVNCKRVSPPALATTMQSIFSALFVGAGPGLGGLLGGFLYQNFGAARMFLMTGGVVFGGWAAAWALDVAIGAAEARACCAPACCGGRPRTGTTAGASSGTSGAGGAGAGAGGGVLTTRLPAAAARGPMPLAPSAPSFASRGSSYVRSFLAAARSPFSAASRGSGGGGGNGGVQRSGMSRLGRPSRMMRAPLTEGIQSSGGDGAAAAAAAAGGAS